MSINNNLNNDNDGNIVPPAIVDGPAPARFEWLAVDPYHLHVGVLDNLLTTLVSYGVFTFAEADEYRTALEDHYYYGALPGFRRFHVPGVGRLYFLSALKTIWENYVATPDQAIAIRAEWADDISAIGSFAVDPAEFDPIPLEGEMMEDFTWDVNFNGLFGDGDREI